jgi:FkbM family methyltransferase
VPASRYAKKLLSLVAAPLRKRPAPAPSRPMPGRRQQFTAHVGGHDFLANDIGSFGPMQREIWEREIYAFNPDTSAPIIFDCGANIGMAVAYFKHKWPQSHVHAFEADPEIFKVLQQNVRTAGFDNVTLHQAAVWTDNAVLHFRPDGSDGGRIDAAAGTGLIDVPAVRLADLLVQPIDFLKIDIEGAEIAVLETCRSQLKYVKRLFVEYHSFQSAPQQLHRLLELLRDAEFRVYITSAHELSQSPFLLQRTCAGMDLQLNIFAFRADDRSITRQEIR